MTGLWPIAGTMAMQDIEYSEKYYDDDFEYRCAVSRLRQPALSVQPSSGSYPPA